MSNWMNDTLGNLCDDGGGEVKTGPFGSQLHQSDYQVEGTPVVMPTDIINGKINTSKIARVSQKHVIRLKHHKLSVGDIVYGRRGDIGRQALISNINEGWLCGTGCLRVTLKKSKVLPRYLHLYLQMPEVISWIQNQAIGATMPNLNTSILRRVPVKFPLLPIQKKIAAIISAYDELIENNNRRIAILEKMAEEIYCEWFVRMRFPGYKKVKFKKGVPEEWEIVKVEKIIQRIQVGKKYEEKTALSEGKIPILDQGQSGIIGYHNDEPGIIASIEEPVIVFANHTCFQRLIFHPFSAIQNVLPFIPSKDKLSDIYWLHYATVRLIAFTEYKGHWPAFSKKELFYPGESMTNVFGDNIKPMLAEVYSIEKNN